MTVSHPGRVGQIVSTMTSLKSQYVQGGDVMYSSQSFYDGRRLKYSHKCVTIQKV